MQDGKYIYLYYSAAIWSWNGRFLKGIPKNLDNAITVLDNLFY